MPSKTTESGGTEVNGGRIKLVGEGGLGQLS